MAVAIQNYVISQGATLQSQLTISLPGPPVVPVDLTGVSLLFSAKTGVNFSAAASLPDTNSISQGVYEFNWTETSTPTTGQTYLTILDTVTQNMAPGPWYYLVRAIGASALPASADILMGVITITQPASARIT